MRNYKEFAYSFSKQFIGLLVVALSSSLACSVESPKETNNKAITSTSEDEARQEQEDDTELDNADESEITESNDESSNEEQEIQVTETTSSGEKVSHEEVGMKTSVSTVNESMLVTFGDVWDDSMKFTFKMFGTEGRSGTLYLRGASDIALDDPQFVDPKVDSQNLWILQIPNHDPFLKDSGFIVEWVQNIREFDLLKVSSVFVSQDGLLSTSFCTVANGLIRNKSIPTGEEKYGIPLGPTVGHWVPYCSQESPDEVSHVFSAGISGILFNHAPKPK